MKDRFISCGMPDGFIADLTELAGKFGQMIDGRATSRKEQALAQAGIAAALASGLEAVRALDIIVANHFRGDGETLGRWALERKVDLPRRPKGRAVEPASTTVPLATLPGGGGTAGGDATPDASPALAGTAVAAVAH